MGRNRGLGAYALLLALLPVLTSCSRATPLCDYADGLATATYLTQWSPPTPWNLHHNSTAGRSSLLAPTIARTSSSGRPAR